jgi:hypothetical protein
MKQLLLISLILLTVNCLIFAQNDDTKIVGHHRNEFFVLKENGYYLVERLGSPLKYSKVESDTLLPVDSRADTFKGNIYTLYYKDDKLQLINRKYKREVMKLKVIDEEAIKNRNRKHNFFYYKPYERKISQYARLLSEKDKGEYEIFSKDRVEMYKKIEELKIKDFKYYFDTFLKKYNFEYHATAFLYVAMRPDL